MHYLAISIDQSYSYAVRYTFCNTISIYVNKSDTVVEPEFIAKWLLNCQPDADTEPSRDAN